MILQAKALRRKEAPDTYFSYADNENGAIYLSDLPFLFSGTCTMEGFLDTAATPAELGKALTTDFDLVDVQVIIHD